MSPPSVWGPPIWSFFHILAENIHEEDYNRLIPQLFTLIRRTCVYLPCPECSEHATKFLAKIIFLENKSVTITASTYPPL